jgi:hypothetical protein
MSDMPITDFSEYIKINKFKLPEECERHSGLFHQCAEEYAEAQTAYDAAVDREKLMQSEVEMDIRKSWDADRDGKSTEGSVSAKLEQHPTIQKNKERTRQAKKNMLILQAAKSAFEHRKAMLDNLVTLLVKGFYSVPNGGRDESTTSEADRALRKSLKRKLKGED